MAQRVLGAEDRVRDLGVGHWGSTVGENDSHGHGDLGVTSDWRFRSTPAAISVSTISLRPYCAADMRAVYPSYQRREREREREGERREHG